MKLSPRVRSVAITLYSSQSVQSICAMRQYNISGEVGSIAHRCADAAQAFVDACARREVGSQVAAVALVGFANNAGSYLIGGNPVQFANEAVERAIAVLDYLEVEEPAVAPVEPKAEATSSTEGETGKAEGDSGETVAADSKEESADPKSELQTDVPTEQLKLPKKTIEDLLAQSTPEVDLSTAQKLRLYDKTKGLSALKHVGDQIRLKIIEAIDKAIGPEKPVA